MAFLTFTPHVNAWSLRKGLRALGFDLVASCESTVGLVPIYQMEPKESDTLFFTEEDSLVRSLKTRCGRFYPREMILDVVDDKFEFSNFLASIGEIPVPFWASLPDVPVFPILFKAKHSWRDGFKLPRGFICKNHQDLRTVKSRIECDNLNYRYFFYQKYLNCRVQDNYSVSGFFDFAQPRRSLMAVSKKILGSTKNLPTGGAVITCQDPENLISRTSGILTELRYQGPFELEFLFDRTTGKYYVLEFNPRFWMQHGLFVDSGNGLIRRYLDLDDNSVSNNPYNDLPSKTFWVDGTYLIKTILTFRFKTFLTLIWYRLRNYRICVHPDIVSAVVYLLKRIVQPKKPIKTSVSTVSNKLQC